jgi:pyruvate formate lyase activating enzyme
MKIAGLQRVTLVDYPDRIAATVFIAGCNLDCGFCHNRWIIDEGDVAEAISPSSLLVWLGGRIGKLDGVCITGGEPLLAVDLTDMIQGIKNLGLAIKLDTNGCFPDRLQALLDCGLVDYIALDIKAPLDRRYREATGKPVDLDRLRRCMDLLRSGHIPWEFRTTVHPLLSEADLLDIARDLFRSDRWFLQPFISAEGVLPEVRTQPFLSLEQLQAVLPALQELVPGVSVRAA